MASRAAARTALPALVAAMLLCAPSAAPAFEPPSFAAPVKVAGLAGGDEPRIVIGPGDRAWLIGNDEGTGSAVVYGSEDGGRAWKRVLGAIPGQSSASIDTDIAVTRTGRIIATELDGTALQFVTGFSDDGGKSWTSSSGAGLIDQDRPWLAVGPDDPTTHQARVYLLFHNLVTGALAHEMFVMTSNDGGTTFGLPVPIAAPGSQAFLDLQCADSGAPSGIAVNPRSGQVYVSFGTRTSPLGGCGASVFGTLEINVVGETRVWVATSPDGAAGSWSTSLAADAGDKVVSASFEPVALDAGGNVYVAYAQTAHPYPDFSGADVRYVWARGDLGRWSAPVVVVPAGPVGHYDPQVVGGDAGVLDLAYYTGVAASGTKPQWVVSAAQVRDATTAAPRIAETRASDVVAYEATANEMGGSCATGPAAGIQNGLQCSRATDDWGLALDSRCRALVVWPAVGASAGTYVSRQEGGTPACGPVLGEVAAPPATAVVAAGLRIVRVSGLTVRIRATHADVTSVRIALYRLRGRRQTLVAKTPLPLTIGRRVVRTRLRAVRGERLRPGRYKIVARGAGGAHAQRGVTVRKR